jgi:hypothetical protein
MASSDPLTQIGDVASPADKFDFNTKHLIKQMNMEGVPLVCLSGKTPDRYIECGGCDTHTQDDDNIFDGVNTPGVKFARIWGYYSTEIKGSEA